MTLDLAFVRSQFPALADGFAYFDNAGGSLVLRNVAERISDYLLTTSVQTGASYEHSKRASDRLLESRAKIARLLNASRPEEIVLGPSTTVLCQFLARAMESNLKPGDEIVVTNFDHEFEHRRLACAGKARHRHQGMVHRAGWVRGRPGCARPGDDGAHEACRRDARLEHSWHHQPDQGNRPSRARERRGNRRRCGSVSRHTGPWT